MSKKFKELFNNNRSLFLYVFAAGSGVIVQYVVFSICINYFNFNYQQATTIGFIVSFPVGFILSKLFAFEAKGSGNTKREMIKFFLTIIVSGIITVKGSYCILQILTNTLGNIKWELPLVNRIVSPLGTISYFAGMGLSFLFNFISHKRFTFVETGLFDLLKNMRN